MWQGTWCHKLPAPPSGSPSSPVHSSGGDTVERVSIKAFSGAPESGLSGGDEDNFEQQQFMLEAKLLASFDHENIIKLIGVVPDNDRVRHLYISAFCS